MATWAGVPHPLQHICALINSTLFVVPLYRNRNINLSIKFDNAVCRHSFQPWLLSNSFLFGQIAKSNSELEVSRFLTYIMVSSIFILTPNIFAFCLSPILSGRFGMLFWLNYLDLHQDLRNYIFSVVIGVLCVITLLLGLVMVRMVRFSIKRRHGNNTKEHVFDNGALHSYIKTILTASQITIPTFRVRSRANNYNFSTHG